MDNERKNATNIHVLEKTSQGYVILISIDVYDFLYLLFSLMINQTLVNQCFITSPSTEKRVEYDEQ